MLESKRQMLFITGTLFVVFAVLACIGIFAFIGFMLLFDGIAGSTKEFSSFTDPKLLVLEVPGFVLAFFCFRFGMFLRDNNRK